ncbi:hypothetical protein [Flavobacterium capsici]|uniref:Uncharacterized protein n=1 Tax=Flavobacterium capsici TaxID=3075618 RepID=A0AA96JBN9_9FLAO|nr:MULTISPECIES: hypothetical protein [unclassified Flavobacterium]WNM18763.1 hypothetical protein RN608_12185 [Flavobacterium sp. PMR2A8]WNM22814.1 hypothetical protein RN605_05485 [Flavobacterium sp. PMTSA4]
MTSKQYFVRTFIFVFIFYTVYKFVGQIIIDYTSIKIPFILKTLAIGFVVAAVLGGINYFAKFNFFNGKRKE